MQIARTRTSRFFLVVLHLVCVSTHLRRKEIAAAISTIQSLQYPAVSTIYSVTENSNQQSKHNDDDDDGVNNSNSNKLEPYWLQDAYDKKCFDLRGHFSECGDANLWRVVPKSKRDSYHSMLRQWIRWAREKVDGDQQASIEEYYALQVFVDDISKFYGVKLSEEKNEDKDCLSRQKKDNKLVIVPCSEDKAWHWKVNEHGMLHFAKPVRGSGTKKHLLNNKRHHHLESCVWRNHNVLSEEAFLHSCDGNQPANKNRNSTTSLDENGEKNRVVQIQFVRHNYLQEEGTQLPTLSTIKEVSNNNIKSQAQEHINIGKQEEYSPQPPPPQQKETSTMTSSLSSSAESSTKINLPPSRVDIAHSHASVPIDRTRLFGVLNPALTAIPKSTTIKGEEKKSSAFTKEPILHHNDNHLSSSSLSEKPIIRKIQMNPYIAASDDERWTDPKTGLVYRTDLCQYLGHERKDAGRHTLTGVGQYTKTMLNIKVYGVGFYASKRDILADPSFEPYASHSSERLRDSPDFISILRNMKGFTSTPNDNGGSFDRTIFLKINMQLSTATMRSSLDSDWKMLTQESKDLLIGSSMRPRPADPIFLEIAKSPDNPNRCTCAQIAPKEYNADPTCCARGTELVFTWRKNGDLEVRLNGVFMDSFPRPDIAEGIFFEYLRLDDPMSFDFLDRVVEGFPFLLAPLSQVKGYATPINSYQTNTANNIAPAGKPAFRLIGGVGSAFSSQAASFADFVQSGAHEISGGAMDKARSVGSTARKMGEEVERRTARIGKHVSTFTNQALSSFFPSGQKSVSIPFPGLITDSELEEIISANLFEQNSITKLDHETTYTRIISRIIGLEDTSMSASNVTQKLFFGMVHLYLLLLLIASFPAKWSTRTKLVVTRKTESLSSSYVASVPTDSDSDESGASYVENHDTESMMFEKEIQLKQSLSYVL